MPDTKKPLKDEAKNPDALNKGKSSDDTKDKKDSVSKDVNPEFKPNPIYTSSEQDAIQKTYSFTKEVSEEIHNQIKILEGYDLAISDIKDRLFFLKEMKKPIPHARRKQGEKSPVTKELRKAMTTEIDKLEVDLFNLTHLREGTSTHINKITGNSSGSFNNKLFEARSKSDTWLRKNRTNITLSIVSNINRVYSEKRSDVSSLVSVATLNGSKAKTDFQTSLMQFLQEHKRELYIVCSGKDSFKAAISERIRKALRGWVPRTGKLTL